MQLPYADYPVLKDGVAVLTSGSVEIRMTAPPRLLPPIKMGPTAELTIIHRAVDIPSTKWEITSPVSDDLKRFIKGKYWCQIDTRLMAEYLRSRGWDQAAETYELLAS